MGAFADRLLRLKEEAGDPSYAEMSSRLGAAASKSSLASAAQGRKLPSWETTWEFVRVLAVHRLGRDPEETEREWRELWERTKAACSAGTGAVEDASDGAAAADLPVHALPAATADVVTVPAPAPRPARRSLAIVGVMALAAIIMAGLRFLHLATTVDQGDPPAPPAASTIARDDSEFVGDITYPDGSKVRQGSSFKKVWRIRNTGTMPWEGRRLARINTAPCRSPEAVSVPPTAPGQTVDIAVRVQAPNKPVNCRIYWKMTDAQGRSLFPAKRPVFLDVQVGAS
ncbi:NBR1-Ig-like domain-containing protein [Sphaerisporangium sp. NBC_01403]|uniref:NBR1-Ig-like domain-containing protein n=1 Tax=Sphaerisporangium sp. NBC_01403 TaxID=2903599 RepID=UPI003255BB2D